MLYVIITDFDGYTQTKKCLKALQKSTYQNFKTVVVDHGPTNETSSGLQREFPETIVLRGSTDLWWTGAVNLGIRFALKQGANRIMLLNNDCYLAPGAMEILVHSSNQYPESIIAPVQRDWKSGRINQVPRIAPKSLFLFGLPFMPETPRLTNQMRENELIESELIIGGRGAIMPVEIFLNLGLFDEINLPHYHSDTDFYLNARKKGINLLTATRAFIDVDDTRTTIANNCGRLTIKEFWDTLHSPRSHRNINHIKLFFRKHYPVPRLYMVGAFLHIGRYIGLYLVRRILFLCYGKK